MKSIKLKIWIAWALILFSAGLLADLYLFHVLFPEKQAIRKEAVAAGLDKKAAPQSVDRIFLEEKHVATTSPAPKKDNFFVSLKKCAPEIAAQAIATPEALLEYLKKSVGLEAEETSVENFHLTLPDGSLRRIHVITADNTNSTNNKELRFFKIDPEGYPERVPLTSEDTLQSLLALGTITKHEAKLLYVLTDGTTANIEIHDQTVHEFQYNNHGTILSCRYKECRCR